LHPHPAQPSTTNPAAPCPHVLRPRSSPLALRCRPLAFLTAPPSHLPTRPPPTAASPPLCHLPLMVASLFTGSIIDTVSLTPTPPPSEAARSQRSGRHGRARLPAVLDGGCGGGWAVSLCTMPRCGRVGWGSGEATRLLHHTREAATSFRCARDRGRERPRSRHRIGLGGQGHQQRGRSFSGGCHHQPTPRPHLTSTLLPCSVRREIRRRNEGGREVAMRRPRLHPGRSRRQ
jgi:hypothetical protein